MKHWHGAARNSWFQHLTYHTKVEIDMAKIYDFKALTSRGKEMDFSQFEGKVLLVVNTASKCGFTPQFAGLEELNQKYKDRGLVIIGFPCNQFKEQDSADDSKIEEFCQMNKNINFFCNSGAK